MNFTTDTQNRVTLPEWYFNSFIEIMYTDDTLADMPLEVLIELFRRTTENLLVAKIHKEDPDTVTLYQNVLDQVQKAILLKQVIEHSHK